MNLPRVTKTVIETRKPVIYIASPYTKGDPAMNTRFQCTVFNDMLSSGVCWPVAPLWSHFQHTMFPRNYKDWIVYDLAMISKYDACVRLSSSFAELDYEVHESTGADGEVQRFLQQGKPVFYTLTDCYAWATEKCRIYRELMVPQ